MSTLKTTQIQHPDASTPAINLTSSSGVGLPISTTINNISSFDNWVSFSPNWSGSLGNGTLLARRQIIGKLLIAQIRLTLGSTTTFATFDNNFAMPSGLRPLNTDIAVGSWHAYDVSTSWSWGGPIFGNTAGSMYPIHRNPANSYGGRLRSTEPFTWETGDILAVLLTYEIEG